MAFANMTDGSFMDVTRFSEDSLMTALGYLVDNKA
jgi:hypothetical protein